MSAKVEYFKSKKDIIIGARHKCRTCKKYPSVIHKVENLKGGLFTPLYHMYCETHIPKED